jgi:shikimate dehydrogenase
VSVPYAEVIGDPIAHSKSPLIHRFWLDKLGLTAEYRSMRVDPAELKAYLSTRRRDPDWRGCNVTMPLKGEVLPFLDDASSHAVKAGAVNTIIPVGGKLIGHNTDIPGIREIIPANTFSRLPLPEACVIGTGGAARAAIIALSELNLTILLINARDQRKGWRLHLHFGFGGTVGEIDDRHNLTTPHVVINATPLGMTGYPAMPETLLTNLVSTEDDDLVVIDLVYSPLETELLKAARRRRLPTVDGLALLVAQAAHAFAFFFGVPAPRSHDSELRELLTR